MTVKILLFALALFAAPPGAWADPIFQCAGAKTGQIEAVCLDRELVGLDRAAAARFDVVVAQADPLAALLLWRDQRWFAEILGVVDAMRFKGSDDPARLRLKDMLARRLAVLDAITPQQIAATPAGTWGNALATVSVSQDGADALQVTLTAKLSYGERDDTLACHLTGTFKPDNGWFAGDLSAQDGTTTPARLRLQGNTLRVVHLYDGGNQSICGELAMMTGTYFPMRPAAIGTAAAVAARTVAPSFKCATAQNSDEEEICADPDLAAQDTAMARVYGETSRRLEPRLASSLRADQRNWVKDNPTAFDSSLHPAANKADYMLHQTDGARAELALRLQERLAMLTNLDEKREGIAGMWEAYNAELTIAPAKQKTDGTMTAEGFKWLTGEYKTRCDLRSDGRIVGGTFKATGEFPTLRRDGALLVISAEEPDDDKNDKPESDYASYCNRMPSAKARLFPVKPAAGVVGGDFSRLR